MADTAPRDPNFVPAILGVSSSDLTTPTKIAVDPTSNRLLVNAIGSTLTQITNQTVNLTQINGVAASVNKGTSDAGTLRVTLGDGSNTIGSVTILNPGGATANQTVNLIQINGVATSVDNGASGTGVLRVTLANNSTGVVGLNAGSNLVGSVQISGTPSVSISNNPILGAGSNLIGSVQINGTPNVALSAGSNLVGSVQVSVLPSIPAGSNNIGSVNVWSDRNLYGSKQTSIYSSTSTTTIITAGGTGVFNDLYGLTITNFSASAVKVKISDTDASNNTIQIWEIPATDTRGFMLNPLGAWPQTTSNKAWTAQTLTSSSVEISALYIKRT